MLNYIKYIITIKKYNKINEKIKIINVPINHKRRDGKWSSSHNWWTLIL